MPSVANQPADAITLLLDGVESTYGEADYGSLFYSLVRLHKPSVVVELGTYFGYSGLHMAAAMRDNAPLPGELHLVDLWDQYPYRHCSLSKTKFNFEQNALLQVPNLKIDFLNSDAAIACASFGEASVDLLHVDISNDGGKMTEIVPLWERKLSKKPTALIIIEGGSSTRDQIEWMTKFNKQPIRPWLASPWIKERFSCFTFEPFPSLTLLRRHT
jgi:Methyltransferase domain